MRTLQDATLEPLEDVSASSASQGIWLPPDEAPPAHAEADVRRGREAPETPSTTPATATTHPPRRAEWTPLDRLLGLCVMAALGLGLACLQVQQSVTPLPLAGLPALPPAPRLPWPQPVSVPTPDSEPAPPVPAPLPEVPVPEQPVGQVPAMTVAEAPDAPGRFHIQRSPAGRVSLLLAANAAFARGELTAAAARYGALRRAQPGDPAPLVGLAAIAWRQGRIADARDLYRRALALSPGDASARLGLAATGNTGPWTLALPGSAGNAERAMLHHARGNALAQGGQWAAARAEFAAAMALAPAHYDHPLALAVAIDHLGMRSSAAVAYRRASALGKADRTFPASAVAERLADLAEAP